MSNLPGFEIGRDKTIHVISPNRREKVQNSALCGSIGNAVAKEVARSIFVLFSLLTLKKFFDDGCSH